MRVGRISVIVGVCASLGLGAAFAAPGPENDEKALADLNLKIKLLGEMTPRQINAAYRKVSNDFHPDRFPEALRPMVQDIFAAAERANAEFKAGSSLMDIPLNQRRESTFERIWRPAQNPTPTARASRVKQILAAYEEVAAESDTVEQALQTAKAAILSAKKNSADAEVKLTDAEEEELRKFADKVKFDHHKRRNFFKIVEARVSQNEILDPIALLASEARIWAGLCEREEGGRRKEWAQDVTRFWKKVGIRSVHNAGELVALRRQGTSLTKISEHALQKKPASLADDLAWRVANRAFAQEEVSKIEANPAIAGKMSPADLESLVTLSVEVDTIAQAFTHERVTPEARKNLVFAMLGATGPGSGRESWTRSMGHVLGRNPNAFAATLVDASLVINESQLATFAHLVNGWELRGAPRPPSEALVQKVREGLASAAKRLPGILPVELETPNEAFAAAIRLFCSRRPGDGR